MRSVYIILEQPPYCAITDILNIIFVQDQLILTFTYNNKIPTTLTHISGNIHFTI